MRIVVKMMVECVGPKSSSIESNVLWQEEVRVLHGLFLDQAFEPYLMECYA